VNLLSGNPFYNRNTIRDPACFVGRAEEIREVLALLGSGQSVSLVGLSKIGKSSLMHRLSQPEVLRGHGLDPDDIVFASLSFGGLGGLTVEEFFGLVLHNLANVVTGAGAEAFGEWAQRAAPASFPQFTAALERLSATERRAVLMFDEFESCGLNEAFDLDFLSALRATASSCNVSYVTATQRRLHEDTITKRFLGSPFYNILQSVPLKLMKEEEAHAVIVELSHRAGLSLEREAAHAVDFAGPHPYFLQLFGYYAFERKAAGLLLNDSDLGAVEDRFRAEAIGQFEQYWAMLWDEEKEALRRISNPKEAPADREAVRQLSALGLVREVDSSTALFSKSFQEFVLRQHRSYPDVVHLVSALEAKDRYTRGHSDGVAKVAMAIAKELGMDASLVEDLRIAARLHDIGKIGIPDSVLLRKGGLGDDDWDLMRRHPVIGAEIVGALRLPNRIVECIRGHQERLDGSGYPDHLSGKQIPLATQILSAADVYDALTTPRVYRGGRFYSPEEALKILREESGRHLGQEPVKAIGRLIRRRSPAL